MSLNSRNRFDGLWLSPVDSACLNEDKNDADFLSTWISCNSAFICGFIPNVISPCPTLFLLPSPVLLYYRDYCTIVSTMTNDTNEDALVSAWHVHYAPVNFAHEQYSKEK